MQTETTETKLDQLFISPTNPRKHHDKEKLATLAESVGRIGVLQPVLARKAPAGAPAPLELIFGTRRFKAAQLAKLETIPTRLVDMTDDEILDAQAIENGQREDVHPLEEAELYEIMMHPPKGATFAARTVDEIVAKVGKSRSWIYARLKLLELTKENRKRFYAGAFDASRALLLARIPSAELQNRAGEELADSEERGSWSYRDAQQHVIRNYMLRLSDAVFDIKDATLVAKAGACSTCPKRTGNQAELFADVASADVCTDPTCFAAKKNAHADKLLEEAKAKQQEVLSQKEVKKAFDNFGDRWHAKHYDSDYRPATDKTPEDKVVLAKTPDGQVHRLVKAPEPKKAKESKSPASSAGAKPKVSNEDLARARGEARAMDQLIEEFSTGSTMALWRQALATYAKYQGYECSWALARRTLGAEKVTGTYNEFKGDAVKVVASLAKSAKTMVELQALALDLMFSHIVADDGLEPLEPLLKLAGVDLKAHMKKATEEIAAAATPGPKKKPAKPAAKKGARS
jgi:ParB/RepB/Spo0J family partition protein